MIHENIHAGIGTWKVIRLHAVFHRLGFILGLCGKIRKSLKFKQPHLSLATFSKSETFRRFRNEMWNAGLRGGRKKVKEKITEIFGWNPVEPMVPIGLNLKAFMARIEVFFSRKSYCTLWPLALCTYRTKWNFFNWRLEIESFSIYSVNICGIFTEKIIPNIIWLKIIYFKIYIKLHKSVFIQCFLKICSTFL